MKRRSRSHRSAGFTLIELFIVLAIIGGLASMAIPGMRGMLYVTKHSETDVMFRNIQTAVVEYLAQNERFPTDIGGGATTITGFWNPPVFSGDKKLWLTGQPGWSLLAWEPFNYCYYAYWLYGYNSPALTYFYMEAASDLDQNGIVAFRVQQWQKFGSDWAITSDITVPTNEW